MIHYNYTHTIKMAKKTSENKYRKDTKRTT
uniref:Uncharacterized protein n=1 Tax=Anguilla anguilla TaxID=7936 RepID=A0A0E9Q9E3_ANGAN